MSFDGATCSDGVVTTDSYNCTVNADGYYVEKDCFPEFGENFIINYFQNSSCSGESKNYFNTLQNGTNLLIGNGIIYYCTTGMVNGVTAYKPFIINGQLVIQFYPGNSCIGTPIMNITVTEGCNPPNQYMPYPFNVTIIPAATFSPTPSPTPEIIILTGQVNLNAAAISLNQQIVGSSVGVICGFTALLIALSLFVEI